MTLQHKLFKFYLMLASVYLVIAVASNLQAEEDIEALPEESSENQEISTDISDLEKCMMKAKSMKDKKNCKKEHMKTVEQFIDEEGLSLIDGFLKIYTDEDNINYYLKLDNND